MSILFLTTKHLFAEVGGTMLEYHKTTEAEKYIISDWKYEGEYALYNKAPYEENKRTGRGFANTKNNFFSFVDGEKLGMSILPQSRW